MTKYIYLITTLILLSISVTAVSAASQSGAKTSVSASIPAKVNIRIYGYTAPNAIVQATSVRIFAQVSSDKTGYFAIDPLPISNEAKEICVSTIDSQHRYGFPLCIGLPPTNKPTEIGPLLLSPTISLSSGNLLQRQSVQANASGQTLPNADVEISFFENTANSTPGVAEGFPWGVFTASLIPPVEAKEIPKLTTKTDKNGTYSINLPSGKPVALRIFTKAFFDKLPTPKSQTLSFIISSYTDYWLVNILPKIILLFLALIAATFLALYEKRTKRGRALLLDFNETRLKPWQVRSALSIRRIWYNFRAHLRSNRI